MVYSQKKEGPDRHPALEPKPTAYEKKNQYILGLDKTGNDFKYMPPTGDVS